MTTSTSRGGYTSMLPSWRSRNYFWFSQTWAPSNVHCTHHIITFTCPLAVRAYIYDTTCIARLLIAGARVCVCVANTKVWCRTRSDCARMWMCVFPEQVCVCSERMECMCARWWVNWGWRLDASTIFFALHLSMRTHILTYPRAITHIVQPAHTQPDARCCFPRNNNKNKKRIGIFLWPSLRYRVIVFSIFFLV